MDLAGELGLVAQERIELGHPGEQARQARIGPQPTGRAMRLDGGQPRLEPVAAGELPEGDGEALDEQGLARALRAVLGAQVGEKALEIRRILARSQDRGRTEPVAEGVAGGPGLAFGRARAARAGAVGAGSGPLGLAARSRFRPGGGSGEVVARHGPAPGGGRRRRRGTAQSHQG
ncbi:MAG: hypothetical protein WHV64_17235, partial [Geminicoccaceae bacterium]